VPLLPSSSPSFRPLFVLHHPPSLTPPEWPKWACGQPVGYQDQMSRRLVFFLTSVTTPLSLFTRVFSPPFSRAPPHPPKKQENSPGFFSFDPYLGSFTPFPSPVRTPNFDLFRVLGTLTQSFDPLCLEENPQKSLCAPLGPAFHFPAFSFSFIYLPMLSLVSPPRDGRRPRPKSLLGPPPSPPPFFSPSMFYPASVEVSRRRYSDLSCSFPLTP